MAIGIGRKKVYDDGGSVGTKLADNIYTTWDSDEEPIFNSKSPAPKSPIPTAPQDVTAMRGVASPHADTDVAPRYAWRQAGTRAIRSADKRSK